MFEDVEKDKPLYKEALGLLNDIYTSYGENSYRHLIGYINNLVDDLQTNNKDVCDYYLHIISREITSRSIEIITLPKICEKENVIPAIKELSQSNDDVFSIFTELKDLKNIVYIDQNIHTNITIH